MENTGFNVSSVFFILLLLSDKAPVCFIGF